MSLEEDIRKKFGKMQDISLERLKPPMAPKPIPPDLMESIMSHEIEPIIKGGKRTDSKLAIDFQNLDPKYQKWALSLETQRHYYYTKFGKVHRKDRIEVKKDLKIRNRELDMIALMRKQKAPLYRECMEELKLKLQEKRVE